MDSRGKETDLIGLTDISRLKLHIPVLEYALEFILVVKKIEHLRQALTSHKDTKKLSELLNPTYLDSPLSLVMLVTVRIKEIEK